MAETLILDPPEIDSTRTQFDITAYVAQAGPDWGDAAIEQFLADAQQGQIPVDFRVPNRTVTIPLLLRDITGTATFEATRAKFQQKAALLQRRGGSLKRQTAIGPVYADVTGATLKMGGSTAQALWGLDADAVLTLTLVPDFYGAEIAGGDWYMPAADQELVIYAGLAYVPVVMSFSPLLYWRLGTNGAQDASGNARNGTAQGGLTIGGYAVSSGDNDAATAFDGVDDYILGPTGLFPQGSKRTIAGWARRNTTTTNDALFGTSGTNAPRTFFQTSDNTVRVVFDSSAGGAHVFPSPIVAGDWFHWAVTMDDAAHVAELFLNGRSQGTSTNTAQFFGASPGALIVGADGSAPSNPFDGQQDEFAIFSRILTAQEIEVLARQGRSDPPVKGDYPARARILLTERANNILHGLMWGMRNRNFSDDSTAQLVYEAERLIYSTNAQVVLTSGTQATGIRDVTIGPPSGAGLSGGAWTSMLSTDIANVGPLTHVGTYNVWVRARSVLPHQLRLQWDVGDLAFPTTNDPVNIPDTGGTSASGGSVSSTAYVLVNLGQVQLQPTPVPGSGHRWRGMIQVLGAGGEVGIERIYLQPTDDGSGTLLAPVSTTLGLSGYAARDEFDQTAGALTAKQLPAAGGTWTFITGGDTDDFTVDATNHYVTRTAVSDTAPRLLFASSPTLTDTAARIDFFQPTATGLKAILVFRYLDANNYGYVRLSSTTTTTTLDFIRRVSGVEATLKSVSFPVIGAGGWDTMLVLVTGALGMVYVWVYPQNSTPGNPQLLASDVNTNTIFGTGGSLASGKVGFGDYYSDSAALTRLYDNFAAWVPDNDAVMFGGTRAELRYDGMFREYSDASGAFAPVSQVIGDLPRLPPAGLEGLPTEILLKGTVGDLNQAADLSTGRMSAKVYYKPSYLFVPEG